MSSGTPATGDPGASGVTGDADASRAQLDGVQKLIARVVPRRTSRWLPTPVVLLVGDHADELLAATAAWLARTADGDGRRAPGIPYALVDGGDTPGSTVAMLGKAHTSWDRPTGPRPLLLRRFILVREFITTPPENLRTKRRRHEWVRDRLVTMYGYNGPAAQQTAQSNTLVSLGLWVVDWVTPSMRAIREMRWLLSQPYLGGSRSHSLDQFVNHLFTGAQATEIDALLVHAVLADLAAEYRRGRDRTGLPVLLVAQADPGTPGGDLVDLIARVRRETGDGDPLLVIGASTARSAKGAAGATADVRIAAAALEDWRHDRAHGGAAPRADAAVMPLQVSRPTVTAGPVTQVTPATGPGTPTADPGNSGVRRSDRPIVVPRPPWWARRGVVPALLTLGLMAGGWALGATWQPGIAAQCFSSPLHLPGSATAAADAVDLREGQCIGVSDRTLFGRGAEQNRVILQQAIYDQNAALDPTRQTISVVYLEQLTGPNDAKITPAQQAIQFGSEVEDLQGLWAAQVRARDLLDGPQLRVLVANAGLGMRHVGEVTDDILALRKADPTVLAVIGGGESNQATQAAVERLSAAGLAVVAPILTTDGFAPGAQNYLQLSRPNADQALLMSRFLAKLGSRSTVVVRYTDVPQDVYVTTLSDDVAAVTRAAGGTATSVGRDEGLPLTDACQAGTTITYTGRWHLFNDFLGRLDQLPHTACGTRRPLVVAGDSISSWVTSPFQRTLPAVRVPSLVYASNGVYCDTLDRTGDGEVLLEVLRRREPGLCRRAGATQSGTTGSARTSTIGERQALAWDAALMVRSAFVDVQRENGGVNGTVADGGKAVSGADVVSRLTRQGYGGAAGRYDFVARVAQRGLSLVCLPAPAASRVTVWSWAQMMADAPIGQCTAPAVE